MVKPVVINENGIDFSFIPSLLCDLECPFCMYAAGPNNYSEIDLVKLSSFINTIPMDIINSFGFYGGEPSLNIELYSKIINMLPHDICKWIITNGSWTCNSERMKHFTKFVRKNKLTVYISSTPYHKKFQKATILNILEDIMDNYIIKEDDTKNKLLPMGRNNKLEWECSYRCKTTKKPLRYAVMPDGNIIFQSCDGKYPIVGNYTIPFKTVINNKINCIKGS